MIFKYFSVLGLEPGKETELIKQTTIFSLTGLNIEEKPFILWGNYSFTMAKIFGKKTKTKNTTACKALTSKIKKKKKKGKRRSAAKSSFILLFLFQLQKPSRACLPLN